LHPAAAQEAPVAAVDPLVVRAHEAARPPRGLRADDRAPVPADVLEGADAPLVAADDDHRVAADVPREVLAGLADLTGVPREEPRGPPDAFHVRGVDVVVDVE